MLTPEPPRFCKSAVGAEGVGRSQEEGVWARWSCRAGSWLPWNWRGQPGSDPRGGQAVAAGLPHQIYCTRNGFLVAPPNVAAWEDHCCGTGPPGSRLVKLRPTEGRCREAGLTSEESSAVRKANQPEPKANTTTLPLIYLLKCPVGALLTGGGWRKRKLPLS